MHSGVLRSTTLPRWLTLSFATTLCSCNAALPAPLDAAFGTIDAGVGRDLGTDLRLLDSSSSVDGPVVCRRSGDILEWARYAAGTFPESLAVSDVDGDSRSDLIVGGDAVRVFVQGRMQTLERQECMPLKSDHLAYFSQM